MTEKPTTTHVLMVVDMSGSMGALAEDVRGGFNEYVAKLRTDDAEYRLTVTLFDTEFIPLAVDAPLDKVPALTHANYSPRGMTALMDAVGKTIGEFDAKHGKVRKSERVLMVIQTDGFENSSREYTSERVKALVAEKEATGRWGFIYLGAGPDAWAAGNAMGMGATSMATDQSSHGTRSRYAAAATASGVYASGASVGETFAVIAEADGVADPDVNP